MGADWGTTHHSALLLISIMEEQEKIIILDEVYEKGLTTDQFIYEIEKHDLPNDVLIYCDSSEKDRVIEFNDAGFHAVSVNKGAQRGQSSVKYAIDYLKRFELIINPKCKNIYNELQTYNWTYDRKNDTIIAVPDIHQINDAVAALRYSILELTHQTFEAEAVEAVF